MIYGILASEGNGSFFSGFRCRTLGVTVACAFMALIGLGYGSQVQAATGLTIQPIKVSYTLMPGQTVTDSITLTNAGDAAVIYPSIQDFVPQAGSSNIQFVAKAPGVTSVVDWVTLGGGSQSFNFAANESRAVPFTISVPKDAEPGSHFGVIFFKAVDAAAASQQLKIGTQVGMLVLITVPGNHLQKGKIDAFKGPSFVQSGPINFTITFENTGTVYFEPKGQISITNAFGHTVGTVPVNGEVVLPTGVRDISATWPAGLLIGPYTANLTLYDGDGNVLTASSIHFFALPIWYMILTIVLIVALYAFLIFLKRRVKFSISLKK